MNNLSLRDYLAGQALQGMLAKNTRFPILPEVYATLAYQQADAMLKEREKCGHEYLNEYYIGTDKIANKRCKLCDKIEEL